MSLTRLAIATAPVLFVLLWSTGFIGARYGLPYIEPLTFLAVRMVFVVVIMAAIAVIGGAKPPDAGEVGHSLVAGLLVHGLYLGGVFTAISQGVPAGISALIPGLQPILTSTIANRFMGETVTRIQWVGLALVSCWYCTIATSCSQALQLAGLRASCRSSVLRWGRSIKSAIAAESIGVPEISFNMSARERCSLSAPLRLKHA